MDVKYKVRMKLFVLLAVLSCCFYETQSTNQRWVLLNNFQCREHGISYEEAVIIYGRGRGQSKSENSLTQNLPPPSLVTVHYIFASPLENHALKFCPPPHGDV